MKRIVFLIIGIILISLVSASPLREMEFEDKEICDLYNQDIADNFLVRFLDINKTITSVDNFKIEIDRDILFSIAENDERSGFNVYLKDFNEQISNFTIEVYAEKDNIKITNYKTYQIKDCFDEKEKVISIAEKLELFFSKSENKLVTITALLWGVILLFVTIKIFITMRKRS